ncbi:hypothetical protein I7I51_00893 [Histoplasma capsulatum]|uniref:Uncharacterized protein n=1 Tax=Ajellomyces capsulatus TaxID=5037 RepID=A0A8A1MGN9_AJECA|nr:hypothetical protein I7I51_00893 [Histoplasma capsulatum]
MEQQPQVLTGLWLFTEVPRIAGSVAGKPVHFLTYAGCYKIDAGLSPFRANPWPPSIRPPITNPVTCGSNANPSAFIPIRPSSSRPCRAASENHSWEARYRIRDILASASSVKRQKIGWLLLHLPSLYPHITVRPFIPTPVDYYARRQLRPFIPSPVDHYARSSLRPSSITPENC